eukprot:8094546-Pyramimonas_sp.AAC.1
MTAQRAPREPQEGPKAGTRTENLGRYASTELQKAPTERNRTEAGEWLREGAAGGGLSPLTC